MSDYLDEVPLRDDVFAGVGATLYLAASPDEMDGLSDAEFLALREHAPQAFGIMELLGRVGAPENMRLPAGFSDHFAKEVLPDLTIIRSDPEKRAEFREALREVLNDKSRIGKLYRKDGDTYSDIATRIAGTNRVGKFYRTSNSKARGAESSTAIKPPSEMVSGSGNSHSPAQSFDETVVLGEGADARQARVTTPKRFRRFRTKSPNSRESGGKGRRPPKQIGG